MAQEIWRKIHKTFDFHHIFIDSNIIMANLTKKNSYRPTVHIYNIHISNGTRKNNMFIVQFNHDRFWIATFIPLAKVRVEYAGSYFDRNGNQLCTKVNQGI